MDQLLAGLIRLGVKARLLSGCGMPIMLLVAQICFSILSACGIAAC